LLVASIAVNVWFFKRAAGPSTKTRKQSARSTLIQGIKNARELTTLRQHFQSVVMFKESKSLPLLGYAIPGTERKFMLKYDGVIVCGNDLENIQITERFAVNRVKMDVPGSKILELYADMKSVQVYDQKAGFFTSIQLDDQNREIAKNLEEVRQNAINGDILRRADENTRTILMSLAASLGMEADVAFDYSNAGTAAAQPVLLEQVAPAATENVTLDAASNDDKTAGFEPIEHEEFVPLLLEAEHAAVADSAAFATNVDDEIEDISES